MMNKIGFDKLEVSLSINASHPQAQGLNLGSIAQLRGRQFVLASLILSQFCMKDIQKSKILTYLDQLDFLLKHSSLFRKDLFGRCSGSGSIDFFGFALGFGFRKL